MSCMPPCVRAQVREFWHALEAATNARQAALFGVLNAHIAKLGRRLEAAVGELLEVALEPAALRLEPPSAAQFHADLGQLFDAGAPERPFFWDPPCVAHLLQVHSLSLDISCVAHSVAAP